MGVVGKDSIIADNYIDMTDIANRTIAVYCKLVDNTDSATIRFDIFDVNGRYTNFDNSSCKKGIKPSVDFQKIVFNWSYDSGGDPNNIGGWNEDAPTFNDGYAGDFWGVKTGHWDRTIPVTGLPRVTYGAGGYLVPLEAAYIIPKFSFSTNGGGKTDSWVKAMAAGTLDKDYSLLIQKIEFGVNPFYLSTTGINKMPNVWFSNIKTSETINLNTFIVNSVPNTTPVFTVDLIPGSKLSATVTNGILSLSAKKYFCSSFVEIVTVKAILNGQVYAQPITVTKTVQTPYIDPLHLVTIDKSGNNVLLVWKRTKNKGTLKYNIYREGLTDVYSKIGELPFDSVSVYIDKTADINTRAYKYKITTTDSCSVESGLASAVSQKTIHLQKTLVNDELKLSWTLYDGSKILGYRLMRGSDITNMVKVDEFGTDQTTYTITNPGTDKFRIISLFADTINPGTLKSDSGPYFQSLSNITESKSTDVAIKTLDADIQTYPNPTSDIFSISISSDVARDYSLELLNSLGEKVREIKTGMIASKIVEFDASTLPSGIYQLMIRTNDAVQINQVVIAR